jgi:hypothetical protein
MEHSSRNHVTEPPPSSRGDSAHGSTDARSFLVWRIDPACHGIHLDSCLPFERIAVRTRMSDYEVVVLPGNSGEVLVRGGRYFSEFRHARLAGSTFGGSAIRARTIEVGSWLELHVDETTIVTSTIQEVSCVKAERDEPAAMSLDCGRP